MSTLPALETCMMWIRPPVASASEMSRPAITSSAAAGIPGSPSTSDTSPSCITPPWVSSRTSAWLRIGLSNIRQYSKRPAHQFGIVDRGTVVAEGDGPGVDELPDLGQFLALAPFADAGHDEHVAIVGPGGLVVDEFDACLACRSAARCWECRRSLVKPPARAAAVPVAMVSSSSRPGSRRWTCMSISPGETIFPAASIDVILAVRRTS